MTNEDFMFDFLQREASKDSFIYHQVGLKQLFTQPNLSYDEVRVAISNLMDAEKVELIMTSQSLVFRIKEGGK